MKRRFISADKEVFEKLKAIFRCSDRMIRNALSYDENKGHSNLARRIRQAAKINGCHTYVVVDEMECFYDWNGTMHNLCPNGAQIEVCKETGKGKIIYKGDVVAEYENVKFSQIAMIQAKAMSF